MTTQDGLRQKWQEFRPSKTSWFWSMVGASILTMILGFTVGGWTTGGTATAMAEDASREARAELVANLCVERFITSSGAVQNLADLKDTSSYQRRKFISDGGWVSFAGMEREAPDAAARCASELAAMDALPEPAVDEIPMATDS